MNLLKKTAYFFIIALFYSCGTVQDSNEFIGSYVVNGNKNNIDTLIIFENGSYYRSLHRKMDKSLVYKHTGKWYFKDGRIKLKGFLMDFDEEYSREVGNYENVLMTCSLNIEKLLGNIYIGRKNNETYLYTKQ